MSTISDFVHALTIVKPTFLIVDPEVIEKVCLALGQIEGGQKTRIVIHLDHNDHSHPQLNSLIRVSASILLIPYPSMLTNSPVPTRLLPKRPIHNPLPLRKRPPKHHSPNPLHPGNFRPPESSLYLSLRTHRKSSLHTSFRPFIPLLQLLIRILHSTIPYLRS